MKVSGSAGAGGESKPAGGEAAGKSGGKKRADKTETAQAVSFAEALSEAQERAKGLDWEALLEEIDRAARQLVEHPTPESLVEYRSLVGSLLERVVAGTFRMETVPSARFAVNQKVFQIARRVDEKLEEMAREILARTADAKQILLRTDEIRGLLLDIFR